MRETFVTWMLRAVSSALLLGAPLLGCGSSEPPAQKAQPPHTLPGGGETIQDHGAPGEAGGAPQNPAGQDAPSPRAPAPVAP